MAHPILKKLELNYELDSAWTPGDFNRISSQSFKMFDFFCGPHDADGYHTNDELIPKEVVIATYAAGTYTPQVATAGIFSLTRNSVGNVTIAFDPDFPTFYVPMLAVFPCVASTELVFAYQDNAGTNDRTALSFIMFDTTPAFVDKDFMAVIFAPRR